MIYILHTVLCGLSLKHENTTEDVLDKRTRKRIYGLRW